MLLLQKKQNKKINEIKEKLTPKITKTPTELIKSVVEVPKVDKRTRRGKRKPTAQPEIKPSFKTRQEPLKLSTIKGYLDKADIIQRIFKNKSLTPEIKAELRTLPEGLAKFVSKHLVAAGRFIDSNPELALQHAKAANVAAASRLAIIREAVGVAAYRCGDYKFALAELKAARRISGKPDCLSLIADCERGLGRPEKAIEVLNEKDITKMDKVDFHELMITVVGARKDLGQKDAGLALAKIKEFNSVLASIYCQYR